MKPELKNHIEIKKNRAGEARAFVTGTRIRVQDIVRDYERHGLTADQIACEYPGITLAQIHSSLAYYFENQADIQSALKSDEELVLKKSKAAIGLGSKGTESDSVSS